MASEECIGLLERPAMHSYEQLDEHDAGQRQSVRPSRYERVGLSTLFALLQLGAPFQTGRGPRFHPVAAPYRFWVGEQRHTCVFHSSSSSYVQGLPTLPWMEALSQIKLDSVPRTARRE